MNNNILLAEDDEDIVKLLRLYLESDGFNVIWAKDGVEAISKFEHEQVDIALVDIMMPKMNGYEVTRYLRERSNLPIIIISAAQMDADKILGLNLGADDYMTKPFNPLEVIARINAQLRRFHRLSNPPTQDSAKIEIGDLVLDTEKLSVEKRGVPIVLTATEFKILALLMQSPGKIFTKVQIYQAISGGMSANDDNTMMVHISRIRDKIEDDAKNPVYIKTIRGLGYKIEKL